MSSFNNINAEDDADFPEKQPLPSAEQNENVVPLLEKDTHTLDFSPREIVTDLDRYIIGQKNAKRAIAVAIRNRYRRMQLHRDLQNEVAAMNILMIGPTGVGKTEIGRRVAKKTKCPFLKVEATKFTEVGYIGRDVDSIPRDLVDSAFKTLREEEIAKLSDKVKQAAEERILDYFIRPHRGMPENESDELIKKENSIGRNVFRKRLQEGALNEKEIDIELSATPAGIEIMGPPGMEDMTNQLQSMLQNLGTSKMRTRRMKVKDALKSIQREEAGKLLNEEELKRKAVEWVEQYGIVFIDEIDKVCPRGDSSGADVSREGVQRDLLPLIEGCTVSTKYGMVKTDHILFIAAGAFHLAKPSDLIPELQGRLPIRVELSALTAQDFEHILRDRHACLITQYQALLNTEGVILTFEDAAIKRVAQIAFLVNEKTENIGARRLYTIMERLLEDLSFEASELVEKNVNITLDYVNEKLGTLVDDEDARHYIL